MTARVLSIALPEYRIETSSDYVRIGRRVDSLLAQQLGDGKYLVRALSLADHPGKTLDELTDTIVALGTDKYDPTREAAERSFDGYDYEFHATPIQIRQGRLYDEHGAGGDAQLAEHAGLRTEDCVGYFGGVSFRFREFMPLARGVSLRVDVLTIYQAGLLELAEYVDDSVPDVGHLAQYLYKFKHPHRKQASLHAVLKLQPERHHG